MRTVMLYLSLLLGSFSLLADSFDFLDYYKINTIRNADNFKGQGYTVGVLENGANHPAVNAQIIEKLFTGIQSVEHGNHVIGILAGRPINEFTPEDFKGLDKTYDEKFANNKFRDIIPAVNNAVNSPFQGGILPEAKVILVQRPDGIDSTKEQFIRRLEAVANKVKIINYSGSPVSEKLSQQQKEELYNLDDEDPKAVRQIAKQMKTDNTTFSPDEINRIKNALVKNGTVLVITASNEAKDAIEKEPTTKYLVQLVADPEIAEHLLIVASIEESSSCSLKNNPRQSSIHPCALESMMAGNDTNIQRNFIGAMGHNIFSAWHRFTTYVSDEIELFKSQSGSSMAAPIVTGIAVLLHNHLAQKNPQVTFMDVIKIIKERAKPVGPATSFGLGIIDTQALFPDIL